MTDAARRHGSTKNRPLNESLSLESEAAHLALESGPEDLLELRERLQALFRQMDTVLTPLERKALLLYLSGCKRSEVENRSGMSLRAFDNAGVVNCEGSPKHFSFFALGIAERRKGYYNRRSGKKAAA